MKKLLALFVLVSGVAALYFLTSHPQDTQHPTLDPRHKDHPITAPSLVDPTQRVARSTATNYVHPHYEDGELIYEAQGASAEVYGEERAELTAPHVTYYGRPGKDAKDPKERTSVAFSSVQGQLNRLEHKAVLAGNVVSQVSDGTRMHTDAATARFKEKTVVCPNQVEITRSDLEISGTELDGRIDLEDFTLHRSVRVIMRGTDTAFLRATAKATPPDGPDPGRATEVLFVTCEGPLRVQELPAAGPKGTRRQKLTFHDRVLLTRQELQSVTSTLQSDVMEIVLVETKVDKPDKPDKADKTAKAGKGGGLEVETLVATGNARLADSLGKAEANLIRLEAGPEGAQVVTFTGPHKWFSLKTGESLSVFGAAGAAPVPGTVAPPPPAPLEITCARDARFVRARPAKGTNEPARTDAHFEGQVVARNDSVDLQSDRLDVQFLATPTAAADAAAGAGGAAAGAAAAEAGTAGRGAPPALQRLDAQGTVLFVEDQVAARADRLVWLKPQGLATLTADPGSASGASVVSDRNRLEGRTITLERDKNLLVCDQATKSRFIVKNEQGGAGPPLPAATTGAAGAARRPKRPATEEEWLIRARRQEITFLEGMREFTRLNATGAVTIFGPTQEAEGDTFTWNKPEGRMVLVGYPWARFVDSDNRVRATRVLMFPNEKRLVLQGRKELSLPHFVKDPENPDAPPRKERVLVTSVGDAVTEENGKRMRFYREVHVVRADSRIDCDQMIAYLDGPKGQVSRVRAFGAVLARDRGGVGAGDILDWSLDSHEVVLRRLPAALVVRSGSVFRGEIVTVSQDWSNVVATNRRGRGEIWVKEDPAKAGAPKKPRGPAPGGAADPKAPPPVKGTDESREEPRRR